MSNPVSRISVATVVILTITYAAFYLGASMLDLWTTELALQRANASEANPFAVVEGAYSSKLAWTYTAIVGTLLTAYFGYGVSNLHRVSSLNLQKPIRSYLQIRGWWDLTVLFSVYFVPRSDRASLHTLSAAIAFVILRLLAAFNNASISVWGDGFPAAAMRPVIGVVGPLGAFIIVVCGLYVVLMLVTTKILASQIVKSCRFRLS